MGVLSLINILISTKQLIAVSANVRGTPYFIQSMKSMGMPAFSSAPAAMAFGGVPIMVPMPPVAAAIGMPSSKAFAKPEFLPSDASRGMIAAITMAVVAVFDISIEATMVVNIKPMSKFLGFVPEIFKVNLKRAWSSFVFVMAEARKKPPSMSQITLLEKVLTYLCNIFRRRIEIFISQGKYQECNDEKADGKCRDSLCKP